MRRVQSNLRPATGPLNPKKSDVPRFTLNLHTQARCGSGKLFRSRVLFAAVLFHMLGDVAEAEPIENLLGPPINGLPKPHEVAASKCDAFRSGPKFSALFVAVPVSNIQKSALLYLR